MYPFPLVEGLPAGHELADAELVFRVGAGDRQAFALLWRRHVGLVRASAARVLHDPQGAEDVAQDVFERLWRRPQAFDPARGSFQAWFRRVARNRAIDLVRRRAARRETALGADPWPLTATPCARAATRLERSDIADVRQAVRRAVAQLPPPQREAIALVYFGDLTHAQLAERTGVPLGTAKTRVRLGLKKLRALLEEERATQAVA